MKFEFKEQTDEKQLKWQQICNEVENTKDKKGLALDESIKSAVISLKANGFSTTASCEGHLDWGYPWPWVDIASSLSERLHRDQHYLELLSNNRISREGGAATSKEEQQELEALIVEQKKENEKECQRLMELLDEFYKTGPQQNNSLNEGINLEVDKGPWNNGRLEPKGVPKHISPLETKKLWSDAEKERKLILYRQEMEEFAEFLKNKFFDKK